MIKQFLWTDEMVADANAVPNLAHLIFGYTAIGDDSGGFLIPNALLDVAEIAEAIRQAKPNRIVTLPNGFTFTACPADEPIIAGDAK